MAQRCTHAEQQQDEEQTALRTRTEQNIEDLERRHQADITDRETCATTEMREPNARIQASATTEKRIRDYEKTLADQVGRAIRGATEAEQATSTTVTNELKAAAETNALAGCGVSRGDPVRCERARVRRGRQDGGGGREGRACRAGDLRATQDSTGCRAADRRSKRELCSRSGPGACRPGTSPTG